MKVIRTDAALVARDSFRKHVEKRAPHCSNAASRPVLTTRFKRQLNTISLRWLAYVNRCGRRYVYERTE